MNSGLQLEHFRIQNAIESVIQLLSDSIIKNDYKKIYLERLSKLSPQLFDHICQNANVRITAMDMKYIICFSVDMEAADISLLFNIELTSVHTARYRIKKKFSKNDTFRMIF